MKEVSAVNMFEADIEVHNFVARDGCQPTIKNIYLLLKREKSE